MQTKIAVIGGGAAALFSAVIAAKYTSQVALIEKNKQLGKKLLITGKGRCNITNGGDLENHISNCVTNRKFLYNIYHRFFVQDIVAFFEENNLELKMERGKRYFPVSDQASDVVRCLVDFVRSNNVNIIKDRVIGIRKNKDHFVIKGEKKEIIAEKVIIATGGKTYPGTGSTGDGYRFAKKFGHSVIKPRAALIPWETIEDYPQRMQGLSLKFVRIYLLDSKQKIIYDDFGEMLFTHFGVSGPIILTASSYVKDISGIKIVIDLKPSLSVDTLRIRIIKDLQKYPKKAIKNLMSYYLPKKMIPIFLEIADISELRLCSSIKKNEREMILSKLKEFALSLKSPRPIHEGIITSGGISTREINPRTMESKLIKSLYFAGEIIDVDSLTGGYNLQIAWNSGYTAGLYAAKDT